MKKLKIENVKKVFILTLLMIFNIDTHSQNDVDNHRKYWYYKSRLNNDFLKVGRDSGESIPFMQRGFNNQPDFKSGDATGMIGYYIAVLATEYKLLKLNNQNTNIVKHELFCALEALNRIDFNAEKIHPINGTGNLNGYSIRDDIPKNFARKNYSHFNYFSNWDGVTTKTVNTDPVNFDSDSGFMSKLGFGVFKTQSTWSSWVNDGDHSGTTSFISQDQVYNVLLGLAFVNKYLPANETDANNTFGFGSVNSSIRQEARDISKRIINQIRNPKDQNGNDCLTGFQKPFVSWMLRQPDNCYLVLFGEDARPFSYPLGEIECLITNDPISIPSIFNGAGITPFACPGSGYHNILSTTIGFQTWQSLTGSIQMSNAFNQPVYQSWLTTNVLTSSGLFTNLNNGMDTRVFITNASAICNCVYQSVADSYIQVFINQLIKNPKYNSLGIFIGWAYKLSSIPTSLFVPGFSQNTTANSITINAYEGLSPLDHGPIAHAVLHDKPTYIPNTSYSMNYLVNNAPCDNIFFFGTGNSSTFEWSSDCRLDHPNKRGGTPPVGEFNGIDFLLYHNLYYLHKSALGTINQNMTDLSNIKINQPSNLNSGNILAYESISIENTVLSYTNPTFWRSGKTIEFKAGTTITGINNLRAYIEPFACATDLGSPRLSNNPENYSNKDSYPDALYHYVKYPEDSKVTYVETEQNQMNYIIELPTTNETSFGNIGENRTDKNNFSVYPSITSSSVKVNFLLKESASAFITIVDLSGNIVFSKLNISSLESGLKIDLSNFHTGIYILKYTTTEGVEKSQKLIKE